MTKCIFSVGPIPGFNSVDRGHGCYDVSQSELARDRSDPLRPLVNVRIFAEHDSFWGPGKNYIGPVLNNPTWRKIAGEATKAMKCTGDYHHAYLEGIHFTGKFHADGSEYVELWMGS